MLLCPNDPYTSSAKQTTGINTSYLTDSYISFTLKMESVTKYHFWPKKDGEKWSRKIYFEIPPCGKIVVFITDFVILGTFRMYEVRESSLPQIVFLITDSILRVKLMYESVK